MKEKVFCPAVYGKGRLLAFPVEQAGKRSSADLADHRFRRAAVEDALFAPAAETAFNH